MGDAVAGFGTGYALATILGVAWVAVTGDVRVTWGLTVLSTIALWAGLGGGPLLASRTKGTGNLGYDLGWRFVPRVDIPVGIGVAVVSQLFVLPFVGVALRLLFPDGRISQSSQEMAKSVGGIRLVVLVLIFAIGAPLVEELFFRGLLLRSIDRRLGAAPAVLISGAVFGLVHAEGGSLASTVIVVVSLAVFGWILGHLAVHYRRLGPGLVAHVTFNLFAVAALFAR